VFGDVGVTAACLRDAVAGKAKSIDHRGEVAERWKLWRAEKAKRVKEDRGQGIAAAALFHELTEHTPEDAILAVDVGNNTYSFGRYFEASGKQRVLMSGYLGSIGFALPAGIGAWAATQEEGPHKGRKVISISGDGGFGQYAMEFTTAVKYGMNLCHVLMNNGQLGKITKEQKAGEFPVWQTELHNPNFATFARGCGGHGVRVERSRDLHDALAMAIAMEGPALVEVMTDAELV
jgi:thiamine pyrophosphate-dependent acetolactate synthase large subunit-like protein